MSDCQCCEDCKASIPTMSCCCAWLLLFVNIFLPGFGTMIMACKNWNNCCFLIGVLQCILAGVLVGWIWAIVWSIISIRKSVQQQEIKTDDK